MNGYADELLTRFLAPDEGLPLRLLGLALGLVFLWRFIVLLGLEPARAPLRPLPPAIIAPAPTSVPPRRWFPTRQQRLEAAIDLVRAETDLLLGQTQAVHASAGLARARAELARLLRELEPEPAPRLRRVAPPPALTQRDLEQLVELMDLGDDDRRRLLVLIATRFEEAGR